MAFLKIFKKGKKRPPRQPASRGKKEAEKPQTAVELEQKEGKSLGQKGTFTTLRQYLMRPHVTEKATALTEKNQYVFVIAPNATKIGVKNAVQQFYNVDVEQVRIVHVPSKRMRLGRIEGIKKGYKKAMVKLKEGQSIEILPR